MSFEDQATENVKIESLTPSSRRVNLTAKVVSPNPVRDVVSQRDGSSHKVTEYLIGDETGIILLTLWDADIEKIKEGDIINVGNAYISLFRGQMRLNVGKFGSLEISKTETISVKMENNLSEKTYEEQRGFGYGPRRSGGGGYGGGGYSGGGGARGYERRGRRSFG